ncbi:MAG: putative Zn-dependent protease [Pseudoalteromonas rhizosphaerae]|jgi:predicted Zn-dependent protease|uniref:Putative beta-barrel assembly-enhancing protease n=1 Tax=Pseudoalteromonas neustonica TaxID=1840331 RepID=A0ABY3F9Q4_9GAMM|nr:MULTISPECIES: M48 family metalloprotease [Pseudoalteromonas]MBB1293345.1 M48 family metallopeptidase [Pseudoalteromonas sp. SR41-4]MBB1303152.1 M48 family metallopeptidase [Pseudoalteromonas sp. SR44-8]MBB1397722.1 M48 family metallopeptidase [Pseudoalteromonas sp. SG44-8]MBB1410073.1 M48 family metallopeptidase [Pseudoalteromonas sp. SG44-17]MBB1506802.1 M48 family metallopeptidase [Pseudoalteromonas sp. SG41-1]|tara:strand:- start:675 stop:2135 length:1461 start_codon:yes stop_codon:yes gene_type:complete
MQLKSAFITLLTTLLTFSVLVSEPLKAQTNFTLPDLGTSALQALPLEKEQAIGKVMMMQIRGSSPVVNDPVLDEYLTTIGHKLVANANDVRFPFSFFWINNPEINAFAFYGGHVGVHTGLIAQSDNESQFASVLGHEIAHVTQRHLARRMQQQQDNSALTIAGMIAGILASVVSPDAGIAIISASQTQSAFSQLTHSRSAEQEADRIGMQTLNNAGFDPYASSEFLTKLAAQIRYKYKPPAFLLTHPLPESRVSDVRLRAQQFEKRQLPDSLEFNLAKSRVIARYHQTPEAAENFFRKLIRENSFYNKTALNYGLGISLLDQKKLDEAAPILDELLKSDPKNLFYIDTHTDLLIAQKKAAEAVKFLAALHENRPNNQVITLNLANAALEAEQYDVAVQILKSFLLEKPEHNLGMQLLADAYKKQDNLAAYHEANADVLAQYGAYLKAADEVQKALNFVEPQELIKQQRLKALLTQYRQMQKELARL